MSLTRNFIGVNADLMKAVISLNVAIATAVSTKFTAGFRDSKLFNSLTRRVVASFGPSFIVIFMSILSASPGKFQNFKTSTNIKITYFL